MPAPLPIPDALLKGPFTCADALREGVSARVLEGRRFRRMFRGVYVSAEVPLDLTTWVCAALLVLPADTVLSHSTAARWMGYDAGAAWPLHFSTNSHATTDLDGICLHRRQGTLHPRSLRGVEILGPDRTFVDSAPSRGFVGAVQFGDWLLHQRWTTLTRLRSYCDARHLDGVIVARLAAAHVRERVESPRETHTRLIVTMAGLPEPETNRDILDAANRFVARGDMPYFRWKVLLEYDGQQHEKDPVQRQRDRERREALEGLGWRVIVVTARDMADKPLIAWRVHDALRARGYRGPTPDLGGGWATYFGGFVEVTTTAGEKVVESSANRGERTR